jgi:competence protein ComEC
VAYPAVLPALAICAGVVVGVFRPVPNPLPLFVLVMSWAAALLAFVRRRDRVVALAVTLGFMAAGCLLGGRASADALRTPLGEFFLECTASSRQPELFALLEGRLRRDAAPGPAGISLSVSVDRIEANGSRRMTAGGVLATVRGTLGGDRMTEWRAGRRVRFPATLRRPARYLDPGVPDGERMLAWRDTTLVGSVKSATLIEVTSTGGMVAETAAAARLAARRAIDAGVGRWSARSAAVVAAILIGDRAGLDDEVERRLQEAGTYHVIAISGGNIAILAGLLLGLLRLCRIAARPAGLLAIVFLSGYAYLVGGGSSVDRATLMAMAYLGARLWDHQTPPVNAAAVAGAAILCVTPLAIVDAGFALTFGATAGILLGTRPLLDAIGHARWIRAPLLLLAASICAEAMLLPVSAVVFSRVTFAGLVLNFAAIPLMTLVQIAAMVTVGLSALGSRVIVMPGYIAHLAVRGLVDSARLIDVLPWLVRRVPSPAPAVVVAYYVGIVVWYFARTRAGCGSGRVSVWRTARTVAGATTVVAGVCIVAGQPAARPGARVSSLQVTFLDVGQGDAALVRFPNGRTLLVDSGGVAGGNFDIGTRVVVPALWALGLRHLDYLAITHGDPDHLGGAPAVLRDLRPRELWEGTPVPPHEPMKLLRQGADAAGAAWRTLQAGDRVAFGGAALSVWHPPPPDWERQRVRDDDSLVLEVVFRQVSVLLTGDIGLEVERNLAPRLAASPVRILKVPHHGSGTSSSAAFLRAARPTVAVISAGRGNPYGHPVASVVQRYRDAGAAIFRTDEDGAITLETDGRTVWIRTFTGRGSATIRCP